MPILLLQLRIVRKKYTQNIKTTMLEFTSRERENRKNCLFFLFFLHFKYYSHQFFLVLSLRFLVGEQELSNNQQSQNQQTILTWFDTCQITLSFIFTLSRISPN